MTKVRRVVTAHNANGRAIVASDDELSFVQMPGMAGWGWLDIWSADNPHFPDDGSRKPTSWMFPPIGAMRFGQATIAPRTDAGFERASADDAAEDMQSSISDRGFHRSATIDIIYIVKGSCVCELDDGEKIQLNEGDTLIQNGTIHAWSNPFDVECQMSSVMIGARNDLVESH